MCRRILSSAPAPASRPHALRDYGPAHALPASPHSRHPLPEGAEAPAIALIPLAALRLGETG